MWSMWGYEIYHIHSTTSITIKWDILFLEIFCFFFVCIFVSLCVSYTHIHSLALFYQNQSTYVYIMNHAHPIWQNKSNFHNNFLFSFSIFLFTWFRFFRYHFVTVSFTVWCRLIFSSTRTVATYEVYIYSIFLSLSTT